MTPFLVYITTGDMKEARSIGRTLIESKLAACVNIIDQMHSMYVWEGELQDDTEVILIAKTSEDCLDRLVTKVKSVHSYDCPCVIAWPIKAGNPAFLDWVGEQVQS